MSSINHRSSSSHSHTSRRTQTDVPMPTTRSSSVPSRQFIIILTNNSEMIRRTTTFQPQIGSQQIQTTVPPSQTTTAIDNFSNNYQNHREQILNNLLRVDLSEAIRNYLFRTRRSFPVHYVFDMSDIESPIPPQKQQQP